jgi:hypothetical protein
MAIHWHKTDSVIALLTDHIHNTRDEVDAALFEDLLTGKIRARNRKKQFDLTAYQIGIRRRKLIAELKRFLGTVGVKGMSDIELSKEA